MSLLHHSEIEVFLWLEFDFLFHFAVVVAAVVVVVVVVSLVFQGSLLYLPCWPEAMECLSLVLSRLSILTKLKNSHIELLL